MADATSDSAGSDWDRLSDLAFDGLSPIPANKNLKDDDDMVSATGWVEIQSHVSQTGNPSQFTKGHGHQMESSTCVTKHTPTRTTITNELSRPNIDPDDQPQQETSDTSEFLELMFGRERSDDADDEAASTSSHLAWGLATPRDGPADVPLTQARLYEYLESLQPEDFELTVPMAISAEDVVHLRHSHEDTFHEFFASESSHGTGTMMFQPLCGQEDCPPPPPSSPVLGLRHRLPALPELDDCFADNSSVCSQLSALTTTSAEMSKEVIIKRPSVAQVKEGIKKSTSAQGKKPTPRWRDPAWWLKEGLVDPTASGEKEKWLPPHMKARFTSCT